MHHNSGADNHGPKATAFPKFVSLFQKLVNRLENFTSSLAGRFGRGPRVDHHSVCHPGNSTRKSSGIGSIIASASLAVIRSSSSADRKDSMTQLLRRLYGPLKGENSLGVVDASCTTTARRRWPRRLTSSDYSRRSCPRFQGCDRRAQPLREGVCAPPKILASPAGTADNYSTSPYDGTPSWRSSS